MDLCIGHLKIPYAEFEFKYVRSSGPGGQNVNKVNSKALLRWSPQDSPSLPADMRTRFLTRYAARLTLNGEVLISSDSYRDQARNTAECLEKLHSMLSAVLHPPKPRRATRPSRSSVRRRLDTKKKHSSKKSNRKVSRDD